MLEQINQTPPSSPSDRSADPSTSASPADLQAKIHAKGLPDNQVTRLSAVIAEVARSQGPAMSLKALGIPLSLPTASLLKPFTAILLASPSDELHAKLETVREYIEWVCNAPRSAD